MPETAKVLTLISERRTHTIRTIRLQPNLNKSQLVLLLSLRTRVMSLQRIENRKEATDPIRCRRFN